MAVENTNYVEYLIELSRNGRKKAFIDLCEINLRNVFTVSFRLLSSFETAQKITLNTFLRAWEKVKDYNGKVAFSTWLKNLAVGLAVDLLHSGEIIIPERKYKDTISSDPESLEGLIISLPTDERIIFVLHDMEGYDYQEIKKFYEEMLVDEIKTNLIKTREHLMSKLAL